MDTSALKKIYFEKNVSMNELDIKQIYPNNALKFKLKKIENKKNRNFLHRSKQ